jgi:sarcosine oxidase
VTIPAEVEFGWDAGGFEFGVSCHRVPIPAAGWQRWEAELGVSLRIRRALAALARRVDIHRAEVASVDGDGSVTLADGDGSVTLADGTVVRGDRMLDLRGGPDPGALWPAGRRVRPAHPRPTRAPAPPAPRACPRPRATGCRFRQDVPDPAAVRALFPSLSPVGQVDCVTVRASWLDTGGDGWTVARRCRVVAFVGSKLMKFAPLLGTASNQGESNALASLGEGGVHDQTKFGVQAAVSAALVN